MEKKWWSRRRTVRNFVVSLKVISTEQKLSSCRDTMDPTMFHARKQRLPGVEPGWNAGCRFKSAVPRKIKSKTHHQQWHNAQHEHSLPRLKPAGAPKAPKLISTSSSSDLLERAPHAQASAPHAWAMHKTQAGAEGTLTCVPRPRKGQARPPGGAARGRRTSGAASRASRRPSWHSPRSCASNACAACPAQAHKGQWS